MKSRIARTLRQRVTNYGDAQLVTDEGRETICTLHKNDGDALLVTVQCVEINIPAASIGLADFRPMIHVEWGHGASSVGADFDCTKRQRIPFACSTVEVQAFIGAFPLPGAQGPVKVPAGSTAKFRSFVSEGLDGLPLFPSQWQTQFNQTTGVLAVGQARLAAIRAWGEAQQSIAAQPYFLLFDKAAAPVGGDLPLDGMPLPVAGVTANGVGIPGAGLMPQGQTRGYVHGIAWGISSTPFVYTALAINAFVAAELLT